MDTTINAAAVNTIEVARGNGVFFPNGVLVSNVADVATAQPSAALTLNLPLLGEFPGWRSVAKSSTDLGR